LDLRKHGKSLAGLVLALSVAAPVTAQSAAIWTVKPQWVRAHEEFLASDALGGRGSATRDEEITATYVASEFIGYGLKPAPGMSGYIQAAEIDAPQLDGHATLTVGTLSLNEGTDFHLITSSGAWVTAPIARTAGASAVP
jgi:hypothetical protein